MASQDPLNPETGFDERPTRVDRLLSAFGALCIVFAAVRAGLAYGGLPERIAIHFNLSGQADGFSGRSAIFGLPALLGFVWLMLFLVSEHMPASEMNIPAKLDERNRSRAYVLSKRLLRFVQAAIGLTGILITEHILAFTADPVAGQKASMAVMISVLLIVISPIVVYYIALRRTVK